MRTTVNIDDDLLQRASELTGIKEKAALLREGLKSLIAHESAQRLAKLGGTQPRLKQTPRRQSTPK